MRLVFSLLTVLLALSGPAFADCTGPAGVGGTMDYFTADKAYKYCNGTKWIPMGGAENGVSQPMRICTGRGPAGQWLDYIATSTTPGVVMTIDTSVCGFTFTPQYFTSLGGSDNLGGHWRAIGSSAIYAPTATGFTVYLYFSDNSLHKEAANVNGWFINWMAVGQ